MRLVAIAGLAAAGCVRVEVSVPSLCVAAERITVDTMSLPTDQVDEVVFDHEIVQEQLEGWPDGVLVEVVFQDGHLAAAGDTATLDFLDAARVRLASADDAGGLPEVEVLAYERTDPGAASDIVIPGVAASIDLAAYLSNGGAVFGFELVARPDAMPDVVELDAELCMAGIIGYEEDWLAP